MVQGQSKLTNGLLNPSTFAQLNTMKLISALLNEQQMDNLNRVFDIAMENAVAMDATECELLAEEIDALKEILIR